MTESRQNATARAWDAIEEEKRRDRLILRIGKVAWAITLVIAAIYTTVSVASAVQMFRAFRSGPLELPMLAGMLTPLVVVLGSFTMLVAILSTVAAFFRLRTASLAEIQLRLAALEDMLAGERRNGP